MANKNDNLIVAYYRDLDAAEYAAKQLKKWDRDDWDVKLGAIGIVTLNQKSGKIEVDEIGQRSAKKGSLWGTAIGATLGVLTLGVALAPGMVVGAAAGGALGALNHKSLGMSDEDREEMVEQLRRGGVALGVMCDEHEVEATKAEMARHGGEAKMYQMPAATAAMLAEAAEAQKQATAAVDEAVEGEEMEAASRAAAMEVSGLAPEGAKAVGALAAATGLSSDDATKLYESGVDKASSLLEQGATPQGRAALAAATGLDTTTILAGVKKLDLMRVKGVGPKSAALLLGSGVDTVVELGQRNAGNLAAKMGEVNTSGGQMADPPSEKEVAGWVAKAKDLPRVVQY